MTATPPKLYTVAEAAEMLHMTVRTLYREIDAGRLNARVKRGNMRGFRLTEGDIDDYIENGMISVSEAREML